MKSNLATIDSRLEAVAAKKPKRLMGFKELCEAVWKSRQKLAIQTFLNTPQGTDHGRH